MSNILDDVLSNQAKAITKEIDDQIFDMLEKAGVQKPFTQDNIMAQGYTLEGTSETGENQFDMRTTYRLLKVVDTRVFETKGMVDLDD